MANDYSVWLVTPTGVRIKLLDRLVRLQYVVTVNAVGLAKVQVPASFPLETYIQEDTRLEIWRRVPGGGKYIDASTIWLVRDWDETLSQRGEEFITIVAYSGNELLDRPIVAYASGTAQAKKSTDYIDDMMKELVDENLGSSATDSDRDLSAWLSIAPDLSDGPQTAKSMAWRKLLPTLKELAQEADDQGTRVFFGITYNPDDGIVTFETRTTQWGIDHSGDDKIVLAARNGTLSDIRRSFTSSNERNYVYVGGQGQGQDRTIVEQEIEERTALSPFNRRELFVDARNTNIPAELEAEAGAALRNGRPREVFLAKIRDTQGIKYGREYGFGDRVVAEFRGRTAAARLDSVEILVERGKEDIRATLRVDE
jgi:hypothetical protein